MLFKIIAVAVFVSMTIGCPTLDIPKYAEIACQQNEFGNKVCRFTCDTWTDIIGPNATTCISETGQWTHGMLPMCQPNFQKCGKKGTPKCPPITNESINRASLYKSYVPAEELKDINSLVGLFEAAKLQRRGKKFPCLKEMCKVRCINCPLKRLVKVCRRCKKRREIVCSKNGVVFGR